MAIRDYPVPLEVGAALWASTPTGWALNNANDYLAGIVRFHKAGTIDRIACYCTVASDPAPSVDARLETVVGAVPSGTLKAGGASASFSPTALAINLVNLTTPFNVAVNELAACVLNAPLATPSVAASFHYRMNPSRLGSYVGWLPSGLAKVDGAATWTPNGVATIVPVYSDGTYVPLMVPYAGNSQTTFGTTSTPDERGNRFTQPGRKRCIGCRVAVRFINANCAFKIHLYPLSPNSASPIAESAVVDYATHAINTSSLGTIEVFFPTPVWLEDGTEYRITMVPTTSFGPAIYSQTYLSAQARAACFHGCTTTRTRTGDGNDGAWTDDATKIEAITPLYDQEDTGGGGGIPIGRIASGGV